MRFPSARAIEYDQVLSSAGHSASIAGVLAHRPDIALKEVSDVRNACALEQE